MRYKIERLGLQILEGETLAKRVLVAVGDDLASVAPEDANIKYTDGSAAF